MYFSNTAVLRSIQQENAKTRKLKYLVTLLLRCLFIAALVLAFAFPYRPEKQLNVNTAESLVGVYIDNSMSMKGQSQRTTMIEDARQSARDLVHKLNPSNRYLLMTNSFEVQNVRLFRLPKQHLRPVGSQGRHRHASGGGTDGA